MKKYWVKIDPFDKGLITVALESGVDAVWVGDEYIETVKGLAKITTIGEKKGDMIIGKDLEVVRINSKEDEKKIVDLKGRIPSVVENKDWTIIPLENLISKTTNLIQSISTPEEARIALEIMERGADGVLLHAKNANDIKEVGDIVRQSGQEKINLVKAKITRTKTVSMSDRCCVDTTQMLPPGQGMLIGNTSSAMFLVHNENVESPYCDPRPFRVNAGAVHAYTRMIDDKTKYLCEVSAGDEVLTCNSKGETFRTPVGRNKIEKRPMMLVEAEYNGKKVSLVMQNAETIRLTSSDGKPLSITHLKKGDEVLACFFGEHGRHFGQKIKETINEQ